MKRAIRIVRRLRESYNEQPHDIRSVVWATLDDVVRALHREDAMPEADAPTTTKREQHDDPLVRLIYRLSPEDRALVLSLAERLGRPPE